MYEKLYEFRISCSWSNYGNIYVNTKNLEEAIEAARNAELPYDNAEFMDDSFEIDDNFAEEVNQKVIKQIEQDKKPLDHIVEIAFPEGEIK